MKKNLKELEKWLNDNKENIYDRRYDKFVYSLEDLSDQKPYPRNGMICYRLNKSLDFRSLPDILFDHSVAKARWGRKRFPEEVHIDNRDKNIFFLDNTKTSNIIIEIENYKLSLREMVLLPTDKERLAYFVKDIPNII